MSILDAEDIVKTFNYCEILLSLFHILMKYIKIVKYYIICIMWNNADDGENKN